jgi:hypothetical protein
VIDVAGVAHLTTFWLCFGIGLVVGLLFSVGLVVALSD